MNMTPKKLAAISIAAVVAIVAAVVFTRPAPTGTVKVLNANAVSGLSLRFNGKQLNPQKGSSSTYSLPLSDYTLQASAEGYTSFTTHFTIHKSDNLTINVALSPKNNPTIKSLDQLTLPSSVPSGMSIKDVAYFYNKTWAVITIQTPDHNTGIIVAKYQADAGIWNTQLGPGTLFAQSDVQSLPAAVAKYMANYIDTSGGEG